MRPPFDQLPLHKGDPPYSAWGLYGEDDQLGALNLLTPEIVAQAAKEIKTGIRVGLSLPLNLPSPPSHSRFFRHRILHKAPRAVHDDVIEMNTQCSTQWDGFRHFGYQKDNKFFNGWLAEDFVKPETSLVNGIHVWCAQGIAGRGVLLDYYTWAQKQNIQYPIYEPHPVPLAHLKACASDQGVEFRSGDILLLRLGWQQTYFSLSQEERDAIPTRPPSVAGVEPSLEMARWLWESGFSACAADVSGFEMFPPDPIKGGLGVAMDNVRKKAEAFVLSYKRAMEMSLEPGVSRTACADALASHYKDGFISFTFGQAITLSNDPQGKPNYVIVAEHLEKFEKAGFGWKVRLATYNIEVYSEGSAQCWLTWEIEPKNGQGWQWTNIYGFRLLPNEKGELVGDGIWEYAVSDNEIAGLLERCPTFFQL
ncbi:hypothetical protein PRZ48_013394 [Zasmidium cellare]|uniref:Uncharacterized protein n=1 Tax=Zasmidium cellare TaxID=395010 RepID=A0ABR0E0W2_ZASCE|nr:hypothetical protein PRZ48_013394 [Zasmidium cellare]